MNGKRQPLTRTKTAQPAPIKKNMLHIKFILDQIKNKHIKKFLIDLGATVKSTIEIIIK